jgi:hypothetical protein
LTSLWYRLADLDSESAAKQFEVVHRATLSVHINVVALNSSSLDEASFRCHTVDPLYWIKPDTYPRNSGEMDGAHIKIIFPISVHINVALSSSSKVIHSKYYKHLKKGAHQSHLGRQKLHTSQISAIHQNFVIIACMCMHIIKFKFLHVLVLHYMDIIELCTANGQ